MGMVRILVETKEGFPCLWESGGGLSDRGESTIIANKDGRPKKALRRGQLANGEHALVPIEEGDYIINAFHRQNYCYTQDFSVEIYKVVEFEEIDEETFAVVEFYNGKYDMEHVICWGMPEWDEPLPAFLEDAVQAAMAKATCYHCREPHFAI